MLRLPPAVPLALLALSSAGADAEARRCPIRTPYRTRLSSQLTDSRSDDDTWFSVTVVDNKAGGAVSFCSVSLSDNVSVSAMDGLPVNVVSHTNVRPHVTIPPTVLKLICYFLLSF